MKTDTEKERIPLREVDHSLYTTDSACQYFLDNNDRLYTRYKDIGPLVACTPSGMPEEEVPAGKFKFPQKESFVEKLEPLVKQVTLILPGPETAKAVFVPGKILREPEYDENQRQEVFPVQAADGKIYSCPVFNLMITANSKNEHELNFLGLVSKRQLLRLKRLTKLAQKSSFGLPQNVDEAYAQAFRKHFDYTVKGIQRGELGTASLAAVMDLVKQKKFLPRSIYNAVKSNSPAANHTAADAKEEVEFCCGKKRVLNR